MKNTILFFGLLILSQISFGQAKMVVMPAGGTATGEATAHIVSPIEITKESDLLFGNMASGPAAGEVIIGVDGSRSVSGGVTLIQAGNNHQAAMFVVTGHPDATFSIVLPVSITLEYNGETMNVYQFVCDQGSSSQLSTNGDATLSVGATIQVGAAQAAGLYTGTFDVTVAYN